MSDWGSMERLDAVVTLADGQVLPCRIHVQGAVSYRQGPETPLEMLNRPEGFFPVTLEDEGVRFLSRDHVAMVTCEWEDVPEEREVALASPSARLIVMLVNGDEFEGHAPMTLPATRSRPLDYVNSLAPFFLLRTGGGARLINRAHVRAIRPLD